VKAPAWVAAPAFADLVRLALAEDGVDRDVTSLTVVPENAAGTGTVIAKAPGRIAGLPILAPESPLMRAFPAVRAEFLSDDGAEVAAGDRVLTVRGPGRDLLALERTTLNFLERLSGIATETARYVALCDGTRARVMETRKTCPGFRALDKYAVTMGGGFTHRLGLHDQILIKENHLLFCGAPRSPDSVRNAIARARAGRPAGMAIEIEVETIPQLCAALEAKADIVLLDNMTEDQHAEAVRARRAMKSTALLEVSGGVTLETVAAIAHTGVDRISVGALTHSVRALDLALDVRPA
jgi:nicotinate-nucleotide pyrophosphorylase (carboxylating)